MNEFKVNLKINNIPIAVREGTSILEAAKMLNFNIPTLCHHPDLSIAGNCRVCVVEIKGSRFLSAACATPVAEGMEVLTNSEKVRTARKHVIELLLSEHNADCTRCFKNGSCELQELAAEYRIGEYTFMNLLNFKNHKIDRSSPSIVKDDNKCIRCQRCVRTCDELQNIGALTVAYKGDKQLISTFMGKPISEVICTNCGQCVNRCPTAALVEQTYIEEVWKAINNPEKYVVVQTAPAIRAALGEELGFPPGMRVTGKLVSALKLIGFDSVLDTDFTADLTIMEETAELLNRLKRALVDNETVALPMMTSCSPGWIKFQEHLFPDMLDNLSTCKSPQQMFGALAKTYYARKKGIDPSNMVSVSIMPCTAKKFEAKRPEMRDSGYQDVDYVLTTRELGMMIHQTGIDFMKLSDEHYDSLMGASTGAGVIFGATGGVMEAALRTAWEIVTGTEVPFEKLNITPVRGFGGIKEASLKLTNVKPEFSYLEGVELKVAVAHGLANAKKLVEGIRSGELQFHFVEVMACPGGCIGGGGQPIPTSSEIRSKRVAAIYAEDMGLAIRKSHDNPEVKLLYKLFLGEPNSHKAHDLLHTHYKPRKGY
ncbi:NADH-dependent [FeFe] hydrogenase, group A6 [uncultured Acetobacteroides sp.]|uniref:NADH-dependent [FeFe] hydrogenase, group A6 n=1 Tax=uncultured Acetobacteroides sp. TaxID=1760811 RepID=UPI0029F588AE|nr:NADH-dependent [FeFe] hydrogenase, group A6 [uncultured Acetobacteroides sp.]